MTLLEKYPDFYARLVQAAIAYLNDASTDALSTYLKIQILEAADIAEIDSMLQELEVLAGREKPLYGLVNLGQPRAGGTYPVPGEEPEIYTELGSAALRANQLRSESRNDAIEVGLMIQLPIQLLDPESEAVCWSCHTVVPKGQVGPEDDCPDCQKKHQ